MGWEPCRRWMVKWARGRVEAVAGVEEVVAVAVAVVVVTTEGVCAAGCG